MSNKNKTQQPVEETVVEEQTTQQSETVTRGGETYQVRHINGLTIENRIS